MLKWLKRAGKVLLVGATMFAEKVASVAKSMFGLATDAKDWIVEKYKAPDSLVNRMSNYIRALCVRQLVMIVGGFVCCFLFDEAKGDLTWFETMLNSARDYVGNIASRGIESMKGRFVSLFAQTQGG